jgi:hypothetical protein
LTNSIQVSSFSAISSAQERQNFVQGSKRVSG